MSPATKLLVKPYFSKPVSCFLKKKNVSICFAYLQNCQSFSPLSQGFRRFICFSDHTVANCNTRGKFSSVEKQYVPHAYLQNCQFFWLSITPDHLVDLFPNLFVGQSPQENVTSVHQKIFATSIFAIFWLSPSPPITSDPFFFPIC